jgi:hypothetical protein
VKATKDRAAAPSAAPLQGQTWVGAIGLTLAVWVIWYVISGT